MTRAMSPLEHYHEAERLIERALDYTPGSDLRTALTAEAHVHATLATVEPPRRIPT